ncbi:alpha/beta hydrolase [Yinghuangia sp. ASG 101]|uniref:alpha/beta fold hydrolase n=1 Tax=Yinghuangia sp. ASG 101 TaxID=2896848 RepID=UPI001E64C032|nr:alpha/beta hydrolase [Yinghuangia sp. ASG 101]UGQ12964.1 alpha/beta hydrolase [Yinghuangia sp. ASG 101]
MTTLTIDPTPGRSPVLAPADAELAAEAARLGAPEGRLVAAGDDALWVAELGTGRPTVFLHGGGPGCTAWTDFAPTVPLFAADRRVLLVDMLNFGFSGARPIVGPRWTGHAARIAAALETLGITDADFVCNSIGGSAALALAADHPHLVRKMVVTGSEPMERGRGPLSEGLGAEGQSAWADYYAGAGPSRAKLTPIMARLEWWDGSLIPEDRIELRYLYSLSEGQRLIGEHPEAWGEPEDLEDKLRRVRARVLFLFGKQDIFVTPAYPVLLSQTVPYADVYLMDDAAHHMEEERPADFTAVVKAFLDSPTANA